MAVFLSICVFVYLCICDWMFGGKCSQRVREVLEQ